MQFTPLQAPQSGKVYNFIVEALSVAVLALTGFLGLVTIATA